MFVLNFVPVKRKCLILIQEQHRWMFMWRDMNLMEKIIFLERNKETGKKKFQKIVYLLAEMQPTNLKAT